MTDRIELAEKLIEIANRCDRNNHAQRTCDLNEIDGGVEALHDAANILRKGLGRPSDEGWPINLLLEIGIVCTVKEAESIEENLLYVMDSLKERDKQILILRYKEGKTYEEMSEIIGVCHQRTQEIEHRILRNLSRPERIDVICNGKESVNSYLKHKYEFVDSLSQLKSDIQTIREQIEEKPTTSNDIEATGTSIYEKPISYLGLSVRAYNCLKRSGLQTIKDLGDMTREKLLNTRNLGPRTVEEIINKAREFGFDIK